MSIPVLILGHPASGKTRSIKNFDSKKCILIKCIDKALTFKTDGFKERTEKNPTGNAFKADDANQVIHKMVNTKKDIIIIDDFHNLMLSEAMRLRAETSFKQGDAAACSAYDVLMAALKLGGNKRVYFLSHTSSDADGRIRGKTLGKMVDDKISVDGFFTITLRSFNMGDKFFFSLVNNGMDSVRSPEGMFEGESMPNDLALVDEAICKYYDIEDGVENVQS